MAWKVIIHKTNGTDELFGEFVDEYWAMHHSAIAQMVYDGNHYNRSEYDGAKWEIVETDKTRHIKTDKEGDQVFISTAGIEYSMYEGISIGDNPKTSDIVYFMLDGYDCPTEMVYWSYGAGCLGEDDINAISHIVDKWEENHREIIDGILDGSIAHF